MRAEPAPLSLTPTAVPAAFPRAAERPGRGGLVPYLLAAPLALTFAAFFVVPMLLVVAVSFFDYESYQVLIPALSLQNYVDVFTDATTWATYLSTLKFCLVVWAITGT